MWSARRCLRTHYRYPHNVLARCRASSNVTHESDAYGIPLRPTWSANELLSSYSLPTLSSATIKRLYELSALIPPEEGTPEHDKVKQELQDLIKLVEAVKLVETDGVRMAGSGDKEEADEHDATRKQTNVWEEASGRELLEHAARTSDGFYVVDADRRR